MVTADSGTSFGSRARQHREALGLTRKELARRINCSIETIRKIESGERYPSVQIVKLLAEHLALEFDEQFPRRGRTQSSLLVAPEYPLIGRQAEWETLRAVWHNARQGKAHLICIAGDAGIGKTRLAEELLVHAHRQGHSVARTRAYALEGRLAYAPIAGWLRSARLAARVSTLDAVWRSEIARLLPELLIEDATLPPPQPLTERWQLKRLFEALLQAFSAAEQHHPLLLLLDDLQWCDFETLEWLQYLLSAAPHLKLLVVGTVRDTEVEADHSLHRLWRNLLGEGQLTQLPLAPLSQAETTRLGAAVAHQPLDVSVADQLFDDCAGNPLFVIESVRFQHNQHSQPQTAPAPAAQRNGLVSLPSKIYAVLQARLERLSPTARAIAELAAVAGRAFTLPLLVWAGGWDEAQTAQDLDELVHRRLVRWHSDAQYDFSHDRIRDVAYAEISPVKRSLLHRTVAQTLESVHADRLDAVAGELAGHYQQADDLERALAYFRRAASVAGRLYAHREVVRYLEQAIAVAQMKPDNPEFKSVEIDLCTELGVARTWIHGWGNERVGEVWSRVYVLAMQTGTAFQRARACITLAGFASNQGDWRKCHEYQKLALPLAEDSGNASLIAETYGAFARTLYHFGELERSLFYFRHAISLANALVQPTATLKVYGFPHGLPTRMALCLWLLGFPDQAQTIIRQSLEETLTRVDVFDRFASIDFIAQCHSYLRNVDMVQKLGEMMTEMSRKYDFPFFLCSGQLLCGWAMAHVGDAQAGSLLARGGCDGYRRYGSRMLEPYWRAMLAEALALAGNLNEALDEIDAGLAFANEKGNVYWNAHLLKLKGDFLRSCGAPDSEAEKWYQRALSLAREQYARSLELRAAMSLARLWQKQGNFTQAQQLLAPIYGWFTEGFDTHDLRAARELLQRLS